MAEKKKAISFALLAGGVILTAGAIYFIRKSGASPTPRLGRESLDRDLFEVDEYKLTAHRHEKMPIKKRVAILQDITASSIKDARMRKLALQVTRHCRDRDANCEARAIYDFIKKNIRYTGDIGPHALWAGGPVEGVDLFQAAYRTVEFGGGDCDDHSILACTLAAHNGLACKYRVTSPRRTGNEYTHIYPMIGLPKANPRRWVALDTTLPGRRYGVEAPYRKRLDFPA